MDAPIEARKVPAHPLRLGVAGPVGSGKTALVDALCKRLRDEFNIAVVTNDIYTKEDAEFLMRSGALSTDRIVGVETGGCPHTAIREDASINLAAVDGLTARHPGLDMIVIESGGDNLAATFSPELADLTIYCSSSTWRPATRSRARAALASRSRTSSSSTRRTSRPTWAPRSPRSWTATHTQNAR